MQRRGADAENRRESKIPRPPTGVKPFSERALNTERKRKPQLREESHDTKRLNLTGSGIPPGVIPAQDKTAVADETFEEFSARTGQKAEDVLNKKLNFKKNTPPLQKIQELTPLLKELRCVGWYLASERERAGFDRDQWKKHAEDVEAAAARDKEDWNRKQDALEQQMGGIQVLLVKAEESSSALQSSLAAAEHCIADKNRDLQAASTNICQLEATVSRLTSDLEVKEEKVKEMEELVRQSQKYSTMLQSYNTNLQNDITWEKTKREELQKARDELTGQVAELGGKVKSLEQLMQFEKCQVEKLREEREGAARDVALLRADLDTTRADRERFVADNARLTEEVDRFKAAGGKSMETLEALNHSKASLEVQITTQHGLMAGMRADLAMEREQRAMAEASAASRSTQIEELKAQISAMTLSLTDAERRVYESELIRRKLHNTIQELKGNIRVFCRVRPPLNAELEDAADPAVDFATSGDLLGRGLSLTVPGSLTGQPPQKHNFAFDKVFAPGSTQEQIFVEISELVQSALDGHKVCIFAYGQTGSGKTFTMLGDANNRGIIPRAMQQVFESSKQLGKQGWSFTMGASMMEIYNEEYKDLLARTKRGAEPNAKKLVVSHDAHGNTSVSDLTVLDAAAPERVDALLAEAMEKRAVGCTALNEQSSRSHMVFSLRIDGHNSSTDVRVAGVLHLVDLAGSERVKESGATGQRLKEAQSINKSLSALGDVIMALANKNDHIPYRNSKLTWLLQPSLGGDAKTLMFVNVAPSKDFAPESLCSLRFAAKVNACEIGVARRNVK